MTAQRTCPNCHVPESRWTENGRPCVNLDPITGNCVRCLAELAKEMGATVRRPLPFDARAAAARNDV